MKWRMIPNTLISLSIAGRRGLADERRRVESVSCCNGAIPYSVDHDDIPTVFQSECSHKTRGLISEWPLQAVIIIESVTRYDQHQPGPYKVEP